MKSIREYIEDEATYKVCMEKALQSYINLILNTIDKENRDEDLGLIVNQVMGHSKNASVFLHSDKYIILQWYNTLVIEIKNEDIAEAEEELKEQLRNKYNCLSVIMGLFLFDGNFDDYHREVVITLDDSVFVKDSFDKIKKLIEKIMQSNYDRYKKLEPFIRINDEILKQVNRIIN